MQDSCQDFPKKKQDSCQDFLKNARFLSNVSQKCKIVAKIFLEKEP